MRPSRTEAIEGLIDLWSSFETFVRSIRSDEWQHPTRCEGWRVCDVVAHVIGNGPVDIATGRIGQATPQDHIAERAGRAPDELADELHDVGKRAGDLLRAITDEYWERPSPVAPFTIRQGIEILWAEVHVHEDDVRAAIGRAPVTSGRPFEVTLLHIADELERLEFGSATLALAGMPEIAVSGGGRRIEADPHAFMLVATGRADPASLGLDETVNIYR